MRLLYNKATGMDGIGPKILKNCALSLYQPLCHLFNISLSTCQIPHDWKIHKVVPVHKSADRSFVANYNPISLLSNTSKILEQLIYNKVINRISKVISPSQFGFMRGRSTVQQLLLFLIMSIILSPLDHRLMLFTWIFVKLLIACPTMSCFSNYGMLKLLASFGIGSDAIFLTVFSM